MTQTGTLSATLEDYLEIISQLAAEHGVARAGSIADGLSVHKSTVTSALKGLAERGLINYSPYAFITLTPAGARMARDIRKRHDVIRRFLEDVLSVDQALAEANACRMEHVMDREVLDRLALFAQFAHERARLLSGLECYLQQGGRPAEDKAEVADARNSGERPGGRSHAAGQPGVTTLDQLEPGERGKVIRVGHVGPIRRRMVDMGVVRGTAVEVIGVAPLGDPIEVKLKGYNLSLRKEEAAAITVERQPA
jgi:DtxR family Mn-dependent transcriptional regulator